MGEHRCVRKALTRMFGRTGEELAGAAVVAGLLEVLGREPQEVVRARAGQAGEPLSGLGVVFAPPTLQHGVVGDVVQDLVAEGVLAHAVEAGIQARRDEGPAGHAGECLGGMGVDRVQRLVPEHEADHRGLLQGQLLSRLHAVEPGLQQAGQRRWHVGGEQLVGVHRPALFAEADDTFVDQHLDQFLHVERVAFGATGDLLAQHLGHLGQLFQQLVCKGPAEVLIERGQLDALRRRCSTRPIGTPLEQRRAAQAQHQHRHIGVDVDEVLQEVE